MAHPGRGRVHTARAHRSIPRRAECRLLNRQSEELAFVPDMFWSAVSFQDAPIIVNIEGETRTWKIPVSQVAGITVVTSYRIREVESNVLWEILSVDKPSDHTWHCVCVKMTEHDGLVP